MATLKEDIQTLREEMDAMDAVKDYEAEWRILGRLDTVVHALEAIRDGRYLTSAQAVAREALGE